MLYPITFYQFYLSLTTSKTQVTRKMDQGQSVMDRVLEQGQYKLMGQPNQILPTSNVTNEVQSAATTEVAAPELVNNQPTKKRKASASGSRQSSACWEHFIRLLDELVDTPTAACKHCHKRYVCDPRTHGTTNMNHHIKKCAKKPRTTEPTQTILTYPSIEGSYLVHVSSKFDKLACRKALSIYVVLDEQPFSAVEGEGFKYYSKVMQPQFIIPSRRTVARDCFQLHLDEKQKLKAEMAEALICTQNWLISSFTFFKNKILMEDFELSEDIITVFEEIPSASRGGSSQCQPQPSGCA